MSQLEPELLVGDCRAMLATLEPESVQCCVTSPPYFGLRAYGTNAQLWGGDPLCAHAWTDCGSVVVGNNSAIRGKQETERPIGGWDKAEQHGNQHSVSAGVFCALCGCWRGELGSEPSVEQFIANLVEVFRAVRRVLRPDGTLWLNLGSSYAGSGKGPTGQNGIGDQGQRQGFTGTGGYHRRQIEAGAIGNAWVPAPGGWKQKDLIMTPFLLAEALRQDGWWLRSAIPWLKGSAMPESVTDRPSVSLEWMFLLAKQANYYYDSEAIRRPLAQAPHAPGNRKWANGDRNDGDRLEALWGSSTGRNRRNGDWYLESLDLLISGLRDYADELEATKDRKGLLLDPDGEPLGLLVNPQALAAAHFASFPEKMVEPLIKASSRPGDVVLDPFGGSGTVGLVARALGRRSILIDLSASYVEEIARPRVRGERLKAKRADAPLGPLFGESGDVPPVDKQGQLGNRRYTGFNARWDAKEAAEGAAS